jgi:flagella basal body P-ring formation protein FlgA
MLARARAKTLRIVVAATLFAAAAPAFAQDLIVVPNRVIYPGQEITPDALDLVALRRQLPNPSAVVFTRDQAIGHVAARTLLPGRLISVSSMRKAWLVEPGQPVEVRFVQGALQISTTGVPLQSGSAGDLIRVRNMDTGVVFSGIVMADGSIMVGAS